jgi:exonuclease III
VSAVSKGIIGYLADRADSHDILLLQEVKLVPARHAKARQQLLDAGYISVTINCIFGMSGILIAVRPTLTTPMYMCDFPNPDLYDARGRVLTVVFSDPPVTISLSKTQRQRE